MTTPMSSRAHVGRRVTLIVFWTVVFVVGLAIGLLISFSDLASLVQRASQSTVESRTLYVAVAVAMVLLGLWGISASHRELRHSVDLIAEVDRARTETIQLESTRYMPKGK